MRSKYRQEGISDLGEHLGYLDSALVVVEGGLFHESIVKTLKELLKRDRYGIYVSLNKPHFTVEHLLRENKIDLERIYFVDCITAAAHYALSKGHKRVLYASHPTDLAFDGSIPRGISHFIDGIPGEKFILVDALRTLFMYNEPFLVVKFIRSLLDLSRRHNVKVVFMARKDFDEEIIHRTHNLFSDVVHF